GPVDEVHIIISLQALSTYLFFFSSRRRHTRFSRDWSSDVCSFDLDATREAEWCRSPTWRSHQDSPSRSRAPTPPERPGHRSSRRSEERRVGKECRSRWSPYQ